MADAGKKYLETLSTQFQQIPLIKTLSEKTGVPELYLALGLMCLLFLLVVFGICSSLIVNLVGILYPAYMSFKAIESQESEDDKQWLTYWIVFSGYTFCDHFIDYLFFWVPFYQVIKMLVLVYMFWPQTRGAVQVYDLFIGPFLRGHEQALDSTFSSHFKKDE